jgi:hypothetical protein
MLVYVAIPCVYAWSVEQYYKEYTIKVRYIDQVLYMQDLTTSLNLKR